jgi:hypothetical protein
VRRVEAAVLQHEEITGKVMGEFVDCALRAPRRTVRVVAPAHHDHVGVVRARRVEYLIERAMREDGVRDVSPVHDARLHRDARRLAPTLHHV